MDDTFSTPDLNAEILNWIAVAKGDVMGHPFHGNQYRTADDQMHEVSAISRVGKSLGASARSLLGYAGKKGPVYAKDLQKISDDAKSVSQRAKGLAENLRRSASVYENGPKVKNDFDRDLSTVSYEFNKAAKELDNVVKQADVLVGFSKGALATERVGMSEFDYGKNGIAREQLTAYVTANTRETFPQLAQNLATSVSSAELAVAKCVIAVEQADPNMVVKSLIQKGDLPGHVFHGNQYQAGNTAEVGRTAEAKGLSALQEAKGREKDLDALYENAMVYCESDEDGTLYYDTISKTIPDEVTAYHDAWEANDDLYREANKQLATASDAYALMSHHAQKAGDVEAADTYAQRAGELGKLRSGSPSPELRLYNSNGDY